MITISWLFTHFCLLVLAADAQLVPTGSAANPFGSNWVDQMAYDPANQTLYLANVACHTIVQVSQASSLPLIPATGAPWEYTVVAGMNAVAGPCATSEQPPGLATFNRPFGVAGWSPYGESDSAEWVGLWVCDYENHAVRFIQFHRGNNVITVAGGVGYGAVDGIGASARLRCPKNVVGGTFSLSVVFGGDGGTPSTLSTPSKSTSVVYWSEDANGCVRQGVPLVTLGENAAGEALYSLIGSSIPADSLRATVLNVSVFAGLCGASGPSSGLAYQRAVLNGPWGVALVDPFAVESTSRSSSGVGGGTNSTVVLFVGEAWNNRLTMLTPMYPNVARFLTVVKNDNFGSYVGGIVVGRVRRDTTTTSTLPSDRVAVVEVYAGTDVSPIFSENYINITTTLRLDDSTTSSSSSGGTIQIVGTTTLTIFSWSTMWYSFGLVLIPYAPNSSYQGTLVILSGENGGTSFTDVLEFYCCLGVEYSAITLTPVGYRHPTATPTAPITTTLSMSKSHSCRGPPTRTGNVSPTQSGISSSASYSSAGHVSGPRTRMTTMSWGRSRTGSRPLHGAPASGANGTADRNTTTLSYRDGSWLPPGAAAANQALTVAGVSAAAMVPGAANKAASVGRMSSVWQCGIVGPAQAVANDPYQFLSFGATLGGREDGGGTVRGALVITSLLRWAFFAALICLLRFQPSLVGPTGFVTVSAMGIVVAVSIGYFTPNVLGLCTATILSSFSSFSSSEEPTPATSTLICAVFSLVSEVFMVVVIAAGVWDLGGFPLRVIAHQFNHPIRRRKLWYFRIAALEDLLAAILIAVLSNIPLIGTTVCTWVAWCLLVVSALHLLYMVTLRPYRSRPEVGISIFLAAVNTSFALLCCVVSKNAVGRSWIGIGLQTVTACFYISLAVIMAVTLWQVWAHHQRRLQVVGGGNHHGLKIQPPPERPTAGRSSDS